MAQVLLALTLVLALSPAGAAAAADLTQVSSDPYTNPGSQHATQVEADTFAYGSTVVAAFQSGRYFSGGGASNVGWATSEDGGANWAQGFLPSLTVNSAPPGPYTRATDPSVAYDAKHGVWMISTLARDAAGSWSVVVSSSTDGGLTWGAPVVVSSDPTGSYDKNWTACDNWPNSRFYGHCYTTWDDFARGDLIYMSTSSDGGLTWSPKVTPTGAPTGLGGIPVVQPNGRVVVPASDASGSHIIAFGSINGGRTWTRARVVSSIVAHDPGGGLRAANFLPSADVDAAGKVYVVWSDCRYRPACSANDLVMSTSKTGVAWRPVRRIPIDPVTSGVDHFLPGLAVDSTTSGTTARLALTYYFYPNANCTFNTCQLSVGFISSNDGGASWSTPVTLAGPMSLAWIADTTSGRMVGDYTSTSFVGSTAVPVFAVANAKVGTTFDEAMYSTLLPVTAEQSYPLTVGADPVLITESYPGPGLRRPAPGPIYTP